MPGIADEIPYKHNTPDTAAIQVGIRCYFYHDRDSNAIIKDLSISENPSGKPCQHRLYISAINNRAGQYRIEHDKQHCCSDQ